MLIDITEDDISCCLLNSSLEKIDPISFSFKRSQDMYHDFIISCNDMYIWYRDSQYIIQLPKKAIKFLKHWINHEDDYLIPFSLEIQLPHESIKKS